MEYPISFGHIPSDLRLQHCHPWRHVGLFVLWGRLQLSAGYLGQPGGNSDTLILFSPSSVAGSPTLMVGGNYCISQVIIYVSLKAGQFSDIKNSVSFDISMLV